MSENTEPRRYQHVEEWAAENGVSRTATWAAVREGRLPHARVGRRVLIPRDALDRLVQGGQPLTDSRPS